MKDIWHEPGEKPTKMEERIFFLDDGNVCWQYTEPSGYLACTDRPWCYESDLVAMLHDMRAKVAAKAMADRQDPVDCSCGWGVVYGAIDPPKNYCDYYIECKGCGCRCENWSRKDAVDAWNTLQAIRRDEAKPKSQAATLTPAIARKIVERHTLSEWREIFRQSGELEEIMKEKPKASPDKQPDQPTTSVSDDFGAWHKGSMEARQKLRDWYDKRVPLTQRVKEALSNVPPVDSKSAGDDSKIIGVLQDINDALEAKAKEPQSALDRQVGGNHYKGFAIQPVEFCELNNLTTCESNAIKYLCRHRHPEGGKGLQDLQKAIDYIQKLIEMRYPEAKS